MKISDKEKWLLELAPSPGTSFTHRHFEEDKDRAKVVQSIDYLLKTAHEDAKVRLEKTLFGNSLDPLAAPGSQKLPFNYPGDLHIDSLKGYFGEIVGAYLIANERPFGHDDWQIPAFRFRMHNDAFLALFKAAQLGDRPGVFVPLPQL